MSTQDTLVAKQQPSPFDQIRTLMNSKGISQKFHDLLGSRAQGFITSVLQVVNNDDKLREADPQSVYGAAAAAAVLDLPINNNLGFAFIIAYNQKIKGGGYRKIAQFQIGYKGFKQLALRTSQYVAMHVTDVREGELKFYDRLSGRIEFEWIQDDTVRLSKKVIGYVSYFKLINGFESTLYMTIAELKEHGAKYSKTYNLEDGKWSTDFDKMASKTVTKLNISKNGPLSIEMQKAITFDQSRVNDVETMDVTYVDNDDDIDISPDDIRALFDEKLDKLTAEEIEDAERIMKNNETNSFHKLYQLLQSK